MSALTATTVSSWHLLDIFLSDPYASEFSTNDIATLRPTLEWTLSDAMVRD
jgi:hypothetical protein